MSAPTPPKTTPPCPTCGTSTVQTLEAGPGREPDGDTWCVNCCPIDQMLVTVQAREQR